MTKLTREQVETMLAECDRPFGAAQFTHQASIDLARELLAAWDRSEGLEADLDDAVEVAFKRGATEWTRLNYPDHYAKFTGPKP